LGSGQIPLASTTISAQMEVPVKGVASILRIYQLTHSIISREKIKHLLFEKSRIGKVLPYINIKVIGR
jgi:hypothetical protein